MSKTFHVRILASDHVFYEGECESLIVPTSNGQYGIMAHHSSMVAAIVPGIMLYRLPGDKMREASVADGMVKIENNDVLVLVDSAERPEDIDEIRAQKNAEEAMATMLAKVNLHEYRSAQAHLARAANRLRVKSRSHWYN